MGTGKVFSGSQAGKVQYPYDAMVYKDTDSGYTIAVDSEGNVIKKVLSASNTDDIVIQAAIDGGGKVILNPNATYYIKSTIVIGTTNTTLESYQGGQYDTSGARLMAVTGMVDSVIRADNCNNISIIDCNISGNALANVSGITFDDVSVGLISRCQFNTITENAIEFVDSQSNIITIEKCFGTNISGSFIYDFGWLTDSLIIGNNLNGGYGIRMMCGYNHIVFNNIFSCTNFGIHFGAGANYNFVGYNRINDCGCGIYLAGGTRNIISSNHIVSCTSVVNGGLNISSGSNYVHNNVVRLNSGSGIVVTTDGSIFVGNSINGNTRYGIEHYDGNEVTYIGNYITSSTLSNMRLRSGDRVIVNGNQFTGSSQYGIYVEGSSNCILESNVFYNNTSGTMFGALTTSVIKNNIGYVNISEIRDALDSILINLGTPLLLSPFAEVTGTSITDYTRQSNALTAQTSVATWYGFQDRATYYNFNGTSHYLYSTNDTAFDFGNSLVDSAFSIVCCVYVDAVASRQIIGKWDVNNLREWRFFLDASGYPTLQLYDESVNKYIGRQDQTALGTDGWKVLVTTYDGSGICAGCKVYLDGVQVDDADYTDAGYVAMEAINTNLMIGALKNAAAYSEYYDGKMTWIGVAAKELSADEVWSLTQRLKGVLGI
jgi:parallel beta-helix repeat protein